MRPMIPRGSGCSPERSPAMAICVAGLLPSGEARERVSSSGINDSFPSLHSR